jgi:hypothetical protein
MKMNEHDSRRDNRVLQPHWHSWGSPIGLGGFLLSVGGVFALVALGLTLLASIG